MPIYVDTVLYQQCDEWRDAVIERLNSTPPDVVVLSNMVNQPGQPTDSIRPESWEAGLAAVISSLPNSDVAVIADTPHLPGTPGICLSANLDSTENCAQPRDEVIQAAWSRAEAQATDSTGAALIDLNDFICDESSCGAIIGSTLVYRDAHHLTTTSWTSSSRGMARAARLASPSRWADEPAIRPLSGPACHAIHWHGE